MTFPELEFDNVEMLPETLGYLVNHLKCTSQAIKAIDTGEINRSSMRQVRMLLEKRLMLQGAYFNYEVSLNRPDELKHDLWCLDPNLGLEVRSVGFLPRYYLYRTLTDDGTHITEDIFRNSRFPIPDERMIKVASFNRSRYARRLSPFRKDLEHLSEPERQSVMADLSQILQYAWHEDQMLLYIIAGSDALDMPNSIHLIEILYLMCFRFWRKFIKISTPTSQYLKQGFQNPHLFRLLQKVESMKSADRRPLAKMARKRYGAFQHEFNRFLEVKVPIGSMEDPVSLQVLLYSNYHRFTDILNLTEVKEMSEVLDQKIEIEEKAGELIEALVGE